MDKTRYFRHFKGNYFKLICFASDSETCKVMVVYRALYSEGKIWVRPAEMFFEEITREGKTFKRFTEVRFEELPESIRNKEITTTPR